ncbi:MAG TPA: LPS biosynthesis choline kinase [Rhodobacteraceae bacterium]|nr:LPS biosynthesis choline kinase [Paracoccaceae bacterium]
MPENQKAIRAALQNVSELDMGSLQTTRLGGLTNLVYRVEMPTDTLIVRIPGKGTNEYIDRAVELHNATAAAKAGISAEIIWADSASGIMISRCIENIETMTPALFASRKGAAARAGVALAALHNSGEPFEFRFELFAMIDEYLAVLSKKNADLPTGYHDVVKAAAPVKAAIEASPHPLAPCHCDPLCENFLDDGNKMWIVDWEYSGMNDPFWDLGDLSVEGAFSPQQDIEMLTAYLGQPPDGSQLGRMVIYKAMCDLLWTLWGLIQHTNGNDAEDFWAYALNRFSRCKSLMEAPEFQGHLRAI